jgi:Flp pilus assembly protein TadD
MRSQIVVLSVLLAVAVPLSGCRPEDQRTETLDPTGADTRATLSAEALAQLDSGNTAFRAGDHEAALTHYRRVTELQPDHSAGWFGVQMAYRSLGNEAAADSALERVRSLAPGASLVHPSATDTLP